MVAAVLAAVAIVGRGQPTAADAGRGEGIVGSWIGGAQGEAPFELVTFTRDGAILYSGAPTSSVPPDLGLGVTRHFSAGGHGTWVRTGEREFAGRIVELLFDEEGNLITIVTADFTATLSPDGDSASVSTRVERRSPAGDLIDAFEGPLQASRIHVAQ
jgi:hypothetical protein